MATLHIVEDFADLLKNHPWWIMFFMTMVHFCILSFRGGALYNYYHNYADKAALYDFVAKLGANGGEITPPPSTTASALAGAWPDGPRGP